MEIKTAVIVKAMPTKIWIESDFSGANHVVIQHEGYEPFRYATFNYDHRYSSNSSVSMHAENLAKSLGAEEPIERKFITLIVKN